MLISLECVHEELPGPRWKSVFNRTWPAYRRWYLRDGRAARPSLRQSTTALKQHMPELFPIYQGLCQLAGHGRLAKRYLTLYNPPRFMSGCTQVVWQGDHTALIRNYDYGPRYFEGIMLYSNWLQPVIAISDCQWGVLDGMNKSGLCVSLAFGGSQRVGEGFGIPLILRYILEICHDLASATEALRRLPVHMTYNLMLLDSTGKYATVFLAPGRDAVIRNESVCTNHQASVDWPEHAEATNTVGRLQVAEAILKSPEATYESTLRAFLRPPLFTDNYAGNFGTLYTASWIPASGRVSLRWPALALEQSFEYFREETVTFHVD